MAPFTAIIFVRILKNILLRVPASARTLDLSRQTWLTTIVVASITMMFSAIDWFRDQGFEIIATSFGEDEWYIWPYAIKIVSWAAYSVIIAASYVLFAIIVDYGRIDVSVALDVSRRHFVRFFCLALIFGAAFIELEQIYYLLLQFFHLEFAQLNPLAPLRKAVLSSFKMFLIWSPVDILADVLPAVTIGVIYKSLRKRLRDRQPKSSSKTA